MLQGALFGRLRLQLIIKGTGHIIPSALRRVDVKLLPPDSPCGTVITLVPFYYSQLVMTLLDVMI